MRLFRRKPGKFHVVENLPGILVGSVRQCSLVSRDNTVVVTVGNRCSCRGRAQERMLPVRMRLRFDCERCFSKANISSVVVVGFLDDGTNVGLRYVAGAGAGDSHNIDAGLGSLRARGRRVV